MHRIPISLFLIGSILWLAMGMVSAQHPADQINAGPFNTQFLEHLVKIKIDSVRKKHGCEPLVNDSILFLASEHHARYMVANNRLTHNENEFPDTKSPQLRAEHFDAKNYGVGENVLRTDYDGMVKDSKSKKTFDTRTYNGLAESMVSGWVHSPGHFANIITCEYQITGVSVAVDTAKKRLYACQTFASVLYKFTFEESNSMFPYSDYTPPPVPTSFGTASNAQAHQKHEWGLKHDALEKCADCNLITRDPPQLTLRNENNNFILRVENSKYVKDLIRNKDDGFAVEIVLFDDYMCGNPEYYTKPSRRNEQCELNGRVLEPLYRKDLYRGYKKRKTHDSIKLLSYIVKADSVPFSERYYQHKVQRFDSEYFEIKLGRVPKDISGFWNHNLVYIQDNQVCHIDYLTGYCGKLYNQRLNPQRLGLDTSGNYHFEPDEEWVPFKIRFDKNSVELMAEDVAPLIKSINSAPYPIDSIEIYTTASPEGDSSKNQTLQRQRMLYVKQVIEEHTDKEYGFAARTITDFDGLYDKLKRSNKWRHLAKLNRSALRQRLNDGLSDSLEFMLKPLRKAEVRMHYTIPVMEKTLAQYILRDYRKLCFELNSKPEDYDGLDSLINQFDRLYRYTHRLVVEARIPANVLTDMEPPKHVHKIKSLPERFIIYQCAYDSFNIEDEEHPLKPLYDTLLLDSQSLSQTFIYTVLMQKALGYQMSENPTQDEVQNLITELEKLKGFYQTDTFARNNIERINFNLHMHLLNRVFIKDKSAFAAEAYKSVNEITDWYLKNNGSDSDFFNLAQLAVEYNNTNLALDLLRPYRNIDYIDAYALPLGYNHVTTYGSGPFYNRLIKRAETMDPNVWCNMFISECGIPFQAFDHEELRKTFCEKCLDKNAFIKEVLD